MNGFGVPAEFTNEASKNDIQKDIDKFDQLDTYTPKKYGLLFRNPIQISSQTGVHLKGTFWGGVNFQVKTGEAQLYLAAKFNMLAFSGVDQ